MAKKSKNLPPRTDPHRPGAIIPADYEYVLSYNLSTSMDGWPIPSHGVNCELDRRSETKTEDGKTKIVNGKHDEDGHCCILGLLHIAKAKFGGREEQGTGCCSICGTHFVYGDVWRHIPTGEYIHVGHQCAHKYSLMADRSAWEKEHGRLRQAAAIEIAKAQRQEEREAFLAEHPGLEEALGMDHPILHDLADRLREWRELSEAQIKLAFKLAAEILDPSLKEKEVPAPEGRTSFEGEVVSAKEDRGGLYGPQIKITVKVHETEGVWLAWGTCPAALLREKHGDFQALKGQKVRITASLKRGRDPHFAIMKRPNGSLCA